MNKSLIISIFLIFSVSASFSQTTQDSITIKGNRFYQNGEVLSMPQLSNILSANPSAYKMIKEARSSASFAGILSCAGGFLIGYPLGTAIGGGEPKWAMAGIGAGLLIIAIPISSGANKKAKKAVRLYNKSLKPITYQKPKTSFCIENTKNGIGIVMRF